MPLVWAVTISTCILLIVPVIGLLIAHIVVPMIVSIAAPMASIHSLVVVSILYEVVETDRIIWFDPHHYIVTVFAFTALRCTTSDLHTLFQHGRAHMSIARILLCPRERPGLRVILLASWPGWSME